MGNLGRFESGAITNVVAMNTASGKRVCVSAGHVPSSGSARP